ncbi:glycosyltransferase family 4 protein [Sphingomonas cavernae]|uniref:Glycosyltransferase n=1 Tax=Sphingomonas cavernae TaxID=2320861 RepID=A0A418W5R7_9SPHN|nr:glycosyltransferase family 4 protein [Sphingomonas cavernae]RJF85376.1 glycosyltransferase [Sphingomonas cavernae]
MTPHILHLHSSFDLGGKEARAVRLMNAFGDRARHTVVSGVPGATGARAAIGRQVRVSFPDDAPSLTGKPSVARYQALARYMRRFDLVLTYNWGAMDAVMARRLFPAGLPPLIHHEDGFNADEAKRLKTERNIFRRIALPAAHALVVPSQKLEAIARDTWKQPDYRVHRIANGINTALYAGQPDPKTLPGFVRTKDEVVVGSVAGLRLVKNLPRLVRAVADAGKTLRLVIVGEGLERSAIEAEAVRLGVTLSLPGFRHEPHRYIGLFDLYAISSDSEQFPISLVEAMAAGLAVAATDVGDIAAMVAGDNRRFVVPRSDERALAHAIAELAGDPTLRAQLGAANRAKAVAEYDEKVMIARYGGLYGGAIGRSGALTG